MASERILLHSVPGNDGSEFVAVEQFVGVRLREVQVGEPLGQEEVLNRPGVDRATAEDSTIPHGGEFGRDLVRPHERHGRVLELPAALGLVTADEERIRIDLQHRLVIDLTAIVSREPLDTGTREGVRDPQVVELLLVRSLIGDAIWRERLRLLVGCEAQQGVRTFVGRGEFGLDGGEYVVVECLECVVLPLLVEHLRDLLERLVQRVIAVVVPRIGPTEDGVRKERGCVGFAIVDVLSLESERKATRRWLRPRLSRTWRSRRSSR